MKKITLLLSFLTLAILPILGQSGKIKGVIRDANTKETLIGANVIYGPGAGTVTDIEGNYELDLPNGDYELKVSYIGYAPQERKIVVAGNTQFIDFEMETIMLSEVKVVADVARSRETPVAFTNVLPKKIVEELATQDIPMLLNTTPGVFATQSGGGDGDARITIRGFNQRYVAVMLDGVPVNDMENGWVYWSNWFGLDAVTRTIQVQRGLGASKLALPAIGGTINIITKGIENRAGGMVKQTVGSDGYLRTGAGYNTGMLANGWGFAVAASYKQGNGWVDRLWTKGWFGFIKVDKKFNNHILSLTAMGAPQEHGQRSYRQPISMYSKTDAADLGIDTTGRRDYGYRYNQHWGYLDRYQVQQEGDTVFHGTKEVNERVNIYSKPQFTLKDFWTINSKMSLSNILYLSIGTGGGVRQKGNIVIDSVTGQKKLQNVYNRNISLLDLAYSDTETKSTNYFRELSNNHFWYGLLSTFNYQINDEYTMAAGIDLRSYRGEHYEEIYDLLGGGYTIDFGDKNQASPVKREGDKAYYNNDGLVRWGGLFFQTEYKKDKFSAFINLTTATTGYKRIDYFSKKVLELSDTTLRIGYSDTINYNGQAYTRNSSGLGYDETGWKWIPGFTAKVGAGYNLNDNMNVYMNMGYLSIAPRFSNVYEKDNTVFRDIENEKVMAVEAGYKYSSGRFSANVNAYYTKWKNRPVPYGVKVKVFDSITGDEAEYSANINGMDALHVGIEIDFIYKALSNLDVEGIISIGDWKWDSGDTVRLYDDYQNLVKSVYFDAKGVHVGDAAQTQLGASLRWEPIKGLYVKGQFTRFSRYYSDFEPLSLNGSEEASNPDGSPRDSWIIPDYYMMDAHAGYRFRLTDKVGLNLRLSVLNVFDNMYISDARNNDSYNPYNTNGFDANSASVFYGLGRRWSTSLQLTF